MKVHAARLSSLVVAGVVVTSIVDPSPAASGRDERGGERLLEPIAQTTGGTIAANDNRRPAGTIMNGVAAIRLFARRGKWRPEENTGPTLDVAAFGEEGGALQIPGPLLRVPEGTDVVVTVRNSLSERLEIHGFVTRPAASDTVFSVLAGETREIRFAAGAPGTYHYWATTAGSALFRRDAMESQLGGAFIVNPKGAATADRVFVMTQWDDSPERLDTHVSATTRVVLAINGFSWPHTERLDERVGRPVRWHIVNLTQSIHPMHLHGFYFSVQGVGLPTGLRYTAYSPDQYRQGVTEGMLAGATAQIEWTPERPGHWLLHCHLLSHVTPALRFWAPRPGSNGHHNGHGAHDAAIAMAGLVMGIRVTGDESAPARPTASPKPRQMTLVMHRQPGYWHPEDAYGFALRTGTRDPEPKDLTVPGPLLVLTRGEPVEITLKNQLPEPTAIHWHGIELDSYYDGVPGWSGTAANATPAIDPRGTFVVRFTPPRAGTFIYHTHSHDDRQLASGLYGALVVVEPGERFDPARDHVLLLGMQGTKDTEVYDRLPVVVNGSPKTVLTLKAGAPNRLRFINITTSFSGLMVSMLTANNPRPPVEVEWQPIAKDGADLPTSLRAVRPAQQNLGVGQTHDFVVTPPATAPRAMWIDVRRISGEWVQQVPVRIAQ
jgi:manganese oxidase